MANDEAIRKLIGFLRWYSDLYDGEWFVSPDKWLDFKTSEAKQILRTDKTQMLKTERKAAPIKAAESELEKFKKQIENCQKCSLHKIRTNFVFGVGNEHADIMFIGEAPGRDEDLQGEPFVGRAGQLLNKMLLHVHLKREDVYIANILKCRPPNNRDPLPEEVEKCIPYLHHQIELIKPKLIVALGRVAAQNLLQTKDPLGKLRKRMWRYRDIPMIVTYHPAAILRNMNLMTEGLEDMRTIAEFIKQNAGTAG